MPKEEAIGITLLDVLTNSFAAALLLMTIVAATVGSGDGNENQAQPGEGTDYVVSAQFGADIKLERPDPPVLTVLLAFKGKNAKQAELRTSGVTDGQVITLRQGLYRPEQWSVFRRGQLNGNWQVLWAQNSNLPDSVHVLVTIGNTGLPPVTLPVRAEVPLIEVKEPAINDAAIKIFNQPIPSLY